MMNSTRSLALCRWIVLFTAAIFIVGGQLSGYAFSASHPTATQAQNCPTVKVSGPYQVKEGEPLTIMAMVSKGPSNITPTYNWSVSAGAISEGQGTAKITVDTAGVGGGTITATVELGGYDRSCNTTNSFTADVSKPSLKVAEYGKIKLAEEQTLLDKFAAELEKDATATGYILAYGGPQSPKSEAFKTALKAQEYLAKQRQTDISRLTILEGGARDKFTIELWVVPSGAVPPEVTPAAKPDEKKPATKKRS